MARADWYYIPIPRQQAKVLDDIVRKEGRKYGFEDKRELVRALLSDFITNYEELKGGLVAARKSVIIDYDEIARNLRERLEKNVVLKEGS